jgi:hypothetical protein
MAKEKAATGFSFTVPKTPNWQCARLKWLGAAFAHGNGRRAIQSLLQKSPLRPEGKKSGRHIEVLLRLRDEASNIILPGAFIRLPSVLA